MVHVSPVSDTFEKDLNLNFQEVDMHFRALEKNIDRRFQEVDTQFHALEKNIDRRFHEVDIRFERVDARFEKIDATLGGINKQIKILTWSMGIGFTIMTAMTTLVGMLVLKLVG